MKRRIGSKSYQFPLIVFLLFFGMFFASGKGFCGVENKLGIKVDSIKTQINDPNPFDCPAATTVDVDIYYTVKKKLREAKTAPIWLKYLKGKGFGLLKTDSVTVDTRNKHVDSSYVENIEFTIFCDSCCQDGISTVQKSSGKQKLKLFAEFAKKRSNRPQAICQHDTVLCIFSINDTSGAIGQNVTCSIEISDTLDQVKDIIIRTVYDPATFSILNAGFLDSVLAAYDSYYITEPDTMVLETHLPVSEAKDLDSGNIAEFAVEVLDIDLDSIYTLEFDLTPNSMALNYLDNTLALDWDIGHFTVLPDDSLPPAIDINKIDYYPIFISGDSGAITDDYDHLTDSVQSYVQLKFYDDEILQWLYLDVDTNGSFLTDELWLTPLDTIDLIAYDLADNEATATFNMQSHFGYLVAGPDTSGSPGELVPFVFDLLNWSYSTHGYYVTITNSEGWLISPPPSPIVLDSMQETSVTLDVTIPTEADIGTINLIYIAVSSQDDPQITDSDYLYVTVVEATPIPTLSEWGMLIMGLLLLAMGTVAVVRRRRAVSKGLIRPLKL